jgi:hypothetical protein
MRTNQMANRKGMMLDKLVAGCYRLRLNKNSTVNKRLDNHLEGFSERH